MIVFNNEIQVSKSDQTIFTMPESENIATCVSDGANIIYSTYEGFIKCVKMVWKLGNNN